MSATTINGRRARYWIDRENLRAIFCHTERALGTMSAESVLAEFHEVRGLASQRPLGELLAALGAKIESHVLMHLVADLIVLSILEAFENVMDLLQMVSILVDAVVDRIENGCDLNLNDVAQIVLGIKIPLAEIARVTNHLPAPQS
jgi:hypothetical protein